MPSMNPSTAPSTGLERWRYVRTGGSALFTAWRTSRRWTPNFRATPLIVPTPNSYSRRNCSNSSTFVLLSTPPLPLVQRKDGTPREKGGPNSVSKVGRHPIANSLCGGGDRRVGFEGDEGELPWLGLGVLPPVTAAGHSGLWLRDRRVLEPQAGAGEL